MKIATFNIQNLFHRDKQLIEFPFGKCVSNWMKEMDSLLRKSNKITRDFERIEELTFLMGFEERNWNSYAVLRRRGGELFLHKVDFPREGRAQEANNWNGWMAIQSLPLHPTAIQNKARVIADVDADVLILLEVEDKGSLLDFNQHFLPDYNCVPYDELYVLQGNDVKGQEFAVMLKNGNKIKMLRSYMGEKDDDGDYLFEKNLVVYEVINASKTSIHIIVAHFKAKEKDKEISDRKRFQQASRVAEIYRELLNEGKMQVIVTGTFDAVSYCNSISPITQETDLRDITRHSNFNIDFDEGRDATYYRMGAYRMGVNIKQKDYLLLSPTLFQRVQRGGLNRKAVYSAGKPQWPVYSSIVSKEHAASEHPVIWSELKV